jgi:transposase-like protein
MPTRAEFSERRTQAKTEVLRRVSAGETLTAVCAEPHMPNRASIVRWAKTDVSFADTLAEAQRRGTWRRVQGFDEAKARAFLARFAAGESIVSICRDPAMPSRKRLSYWRLTQGEFGGELFWLIRRQKAERSRGAAYSAPRAWDEALADRILLHVGRGHSVRRLRRVDPTLPGAGVIARWRRERPDFDSDLRVNMAAGRYARVPARMAAVLDPLRDRIIEGGSLQSLGGKHGLPSRATLYNWVRRSSDFAREIAQACEHREDWYTDQLQMIAEEAQVLGVAEARRRMAPLVRQLGRLSQRPGMKGRG